MFKGISHRIALQFTAFVFVLFLVNGAIFLAADFSSARKQMGQRLEREAFGVLRQIERLPVQQIRVLPPHIRDRIRIVDALGNTVHEGGVFQDIPFAPIEGFTDVSVGGDRYRLLTVPIAREGFIVGYAQFADVERLSLRDLPVRAVLYLVISIIVSALTYVAGLWFARRSLRPAEETMQRLEQFTQDASHELRTPIAVVNSSLDLALKTGDHEEGIRSAKRDLKQISTLVERLLELARLDRLTVDKADVDLSALVSQSVEKHRLIAADRNVVIEADVAPGVRVRGDEALMRQVVANLLGNAIKFNKAGGRVMVRLRRDSLAVEDTGIGIPAGARQHIFDRFFQADPSRSARDSVSGHGLGLAMVKRIADLHKWTVRVKSAEGKGTTFVVTFA